MSGEKQNHVYFEKIGYPQCNTTLYSLELPNKRDKYQANVAEYVEQAELAFTADQTINWCNHFGKQWVIYTKTEHKHTPRTNNFTTRYRMCYTEMYSCVPKVMQKSTLQGYYSLWLKTGSSLDVHQQQNG